ncbi:hypothetical protein FU659_18990 [Paenibacillus sp. N3.4]|nr:hypothetical protein FU659_18990 [Paenibacillus sp. N3.4]
MNRHKNFFVLICEIVWIMPDSVCAMYKLL